MKQDNNLNIIAVSSGNYPSNAAANIRHLAILRGLNENGANVRLLSLLAQGVDIKKRDSYCNIKIYHAVVYKGAKIHKTVKLFLYIFGIVKIAIELIEQKRKKQLDVVILYPTLVSYLLPLIIMSKLLNVKIFHERTEFPLLNDSDSLMNRMSRSLYLKIIIPLFDGLFVISSFLVEFFRIYFNNDIILIPIVVEPSRFKSQQGSIFKFPYIAYCGNLGFSKDGVDILIDSFAEIGDEFQDYKLVMIGNLEKSPDRVALLKKIDDYHLNERIVFTGELSFEQIPNLLVNSEALLLSRPDNIQAKYGLPTKLGEYLITGNPVVVTAVGDIPLYLKDEVNAFIAEPGSSSSFAEKIKLVLNNYDKALSIGQNGKNVCNKVFNYAYQSHKLLVFFKRSCHAE